MSVVDSLMEEWRMLALLSAMFITKKYLVVIYPTVLQSTVHRGVVSIEKEKVYICQLVSETNANPRRYCDNGRSGVAKVSQFNPVPVIVADRIVPIDEPSIEDLPTEHRSADEVVVPAFHFVPSPSPGRHRDGTGIATAADCDLHHTRLSDP
jgi:hypothetical protein